MTFYSYFSIYKHSLNLVESGDILKRSYASRLNFSYIPQYPDASCKIINSIDTSRKAMCPIDKRREVIYPRI